MKHGERLLRIGLIGLVLLSVYLSMNIWFNWTKKEYPIQKTTPSAAVNERKASDVFLPLRLVYLLPDRAQMTNSESVISALKSELKKVKKYGKLTQIVDKNEAAFAHYVHPKEGFELLYEGAFLVDEFVSVFNLPIDLADFSEQSLYFTSVQVDFTKQQMYFLNFNQKNVYAVPMSFSAETFVKILAKKEIPYYAVSEKTHTVAEKQYYLTNDLSLKKYSYILASQPITRFRNAFFANVDELRTNEDSEDLSYTSSNENLTADERLGTIHFKSVLEDVSEQNIYDKSFSYVKKLGSNMGLIRYFDRTQTSIHYRTFVEGFPVFSEENKGQVNISLTQLDEETHLTIDTSVDTIQVPIPSEEVVTLKSTLALLEGLQSAGVDVQKINATVIGYTWQTIEETKQIVDLTPEWYILYEDTWYPERVLLQEKGESEASTS